MLSCVLDAPRLEQRFGDGDEVFGRYPALQAVDDAVALEHQQQVGVGTLGPFSDEEAFCACQERRCRYTYFFNDRKLASEFGLTIPADGYLVIAKADTLPKTNQPDVWAIGSKLDLINIKNAYKEEEIRSLLKIGIIILIYISYVIFCLAEPFIKI